MTSEAIVAVSAAVVALVQLAKWTGLPDKWGPVVVIAFAGLGSFIWLVSQAVWPPARTDIWPIFSGWIAVALSAAGVFGFTRATVSAVTSAKPPPLAAAGSNSVVEPSSQDAEDEAAAEAILLHAKQLRKEFPDALKKESRP